MTVTKSISRDDVRASILQASLALMNEGGLGALSMREVARRAGVSHQAPYHYFADREAILVGSSRVDLQACKLEYSIVSPK